RLRLVARLEQGDLTGVDADIGAYARAAERLRLPLYTWPVPVWRGMRALLDGDIPAARRFAGEAEATGRQAGSANAEMMVWALRIAAARAEGTMSDQVAAIETMLPGAADYPAWHCCLAAVFAEAGRADRAPLAPGAGGHAARRARCRPGGPRRPRPLRPSLGGGRDRRGLLRPGLRPVGPPERLPHRRRRRPRGRRRRRRPWRSRRRVPPGRTPVAPALPGPAGD